MSFSISGPVRLGRFGTIIVLHDLERALAAIEAALAKTGMSEAQCTSALGPVREKLKSFNATPASRSQERVAFAQRLQDFHFRVNGLLDGRIFRDPSWPMLLELFIASYCGRFVSVTELSRRLKLTPTTGLRHIEKMEGEGLVSRRDDPQDARRTFVEPTVKATQGVGRVLDEMRSVFTT